METTREGRRRMLRIMRFVKSEGRLARLAEPSDEAKARMRKYKEFINEIRQLK